MKRILGTAAILAITACGPQQVPIKAKWTEAIKNFALTAVYPMREDVFIGTVRLARINDADDFTLGSRSLGYVDVSAVLSASEKTKPTYPKAMITDAKVMDNALKALTWQQPEQPLTTRSQGNRLRLAALPGVSLVRLNSADLENAGVLGAIAGSFEASSNLDISLLGIETLELDDIAAAGVMRATVLAALRDQGDTGMLWRSGLCVSAKALGVPLDQTQITMITRVFYAHGIEYKYSNKFEAGLVAETANAGGGDNADANADAAQNAAGGDTAAAGGAPATGQATKEADAEETEVMLSLTAPGSAAKLTTRDTTDLHQSEIFERPLAFGVGGISVRASNLGFHCNPKGPAATFGKPFGAKLDSSSIFNPANMANVVVRPATPITPDQPGQGPLNANADCAQLSFEQRQLIPRCRKAEK